MTELKPCPCCKGSDLDVRGTVFCCECGLQALSVEHWNTRAPDDLVERIKKWLGAIGEPHVYDGIDGIDGKPEELRRAEKYVRDSLLQNIEHWEQGDLRYPLPPPEERGK